MRSTRRDVRVLGRPRPREERGQALVEWLLWAVVMLGMATGLMAIAVPVLRRVPAAVGGWLASVAP